jgi:hypothetical protein
MEAPLLSRLCQRKLDALVTDVARYGRDGERLCLRFLWSECSGGQRPVLSHLVPTLEGTDGVRASTGRCLCGQIANPDYVARGEAPR